MMTLLLALSYSTTTTHAVAGVSPTFLSLYGLFFLWLGTRLRH